MAYTVEISSTAYRLAKKLPKNIRQVVVDHAKKLAIKPHAGEKLKGKYSYLLTGDCQIPILGTAGIRTRKCLWIPPACTLPKGHLTQISVLDELFILMGVIRPYCGLAVGSNHVARASALNTMAPLSSLLPG